MTRYEVGQRALAFLDPPPEGPSSAQLLWVLSDINGAFTEIGQEGPSTLFSTRRSSGGLGGSTSLSVITVSDSPLMTIGHDSWLDKMLGSAILVPGDPRVNRIEQYVKAASTGTITFAGIPSNTETVTIGDVTYRFMTTPVAAYHVEIGATAGICRDNLLATMRYKPYDLILTYPSGAPFYPTGTEQHPTVTGEPSGTPTTPTITLTALTPGSTGDTIVLSEATASAITVSGATLTGGTNNQIRVQFPFIGTGATLTAVVYYDSWPLRTDEQNAGGPVLFESLSDGTRSRLKPFIGGWEEWQEDQQQSRNFTTVAALPEYFLVEHSQSYLGTEDDRRFVTPTRWLRVSRWPSSTGAVSYQANLFPPQFALTDITLDQGNARFPTGLPDGWDDMVLMPIIMWRMLAWLDFPTPVQSAQESIRTGIHEKYKRALRFLRDQRPQAEMPEEMTAS